MLNIGNEIMQKCMSYWETITKISKYNNNNLKTAISQYYNLIGIPTLSEYRYLLSINEYDLFPYNCKVKIITDINILSKSNIPHRFAGQETNIIGININTDVCGNLYFTYLLSCCKWIYFPREMFVLSE